MSDLHIMVQDRDQSVKKKAQVRLREKLLAGEPATIEELAEARGLVIREREDSIFSDAWVPLALIFLGIGLAGGRNLALISLGIVLLLIVGVSTWWKNQALVNVLYQRRFDRTNVFPGEKITMTLRVTNEKPLPLTWLRFIDELPVAVDLSSVYAEIAAETSGRFQLSNTFSIAGGETTERQMTLTFPRRGYHRLGPVKYRSGDIFTLFTVEREFDYRQTIVIYPEIWPLEALGLPAKEPFGEVKVRRSLFTDPIKTQGIRDYQPQDRYRDVHWKATARRGSLQTKIYEPSTGMTMAVFLNVATYAKHWMGYSPELLERAISVAASIANYGAQHGWGLGFYANGSVPRSDQPIRVRPGRSPEQLNHVLEALAAVTEFATGSIEGLMHRESPRLPWAATMVVVTAFVTDELAVTLLRLKESGRRVVLISLAEEPPPHGLYGILSYHIPSSAPAFQEEPTTSTATEAALGAIPVPAGIELDFEEESGRRWNGINRT